MPDTLLPIRIHTRLWKIDWWLFNTITDNHIINEPQTKGGKSVRNIIMNKLISAHSACWSFSVLVSAWPKRKPYILCTHCTLTRSLRVCRFWCHVRHTHTEHVIVLFEFEIFDTLNRLFGIACGLHINSCANDIISSSSQKHSFLYCVYWV